MRTLIINVATEVERREFQLQQMGRCSLEYELIRAFTPINLREDESEYLGYNWQRPLREVEICCLQSHIFAWQNVIDAERPALILEDDAYLCSNISAIIASLKSNQDFEFISLETRRKKKLLSKNSQTLYGGYQIHKLVKGGRGAAAYVLTPQGARKLVSFVRERGFAIADAVIEDCPKLRKGQVSPAPALQIDMCEAYRLLAPIKTKTSIDSPVNCKPRPRCLFEFLQMKRKRIFARSKSLMKLAILRAFYTYRVPHVVNSDFSK